MPKRIIALLLAGLSIGGIFFIYAFKTRGGNFYDALLTSDTVDETELLAELPLDTTTASDSSSYGFDVYTAKPGKFTKINLINISIPVFVVVYADDGGNLGEQLGVSKYIEPGFHTDLEVELSRETVAGEVIHYVLYSDDGNKQYGDQTDIPVREGQHNSATRDVTVSE
jgi:hypothetical protein